MEASGLVIFRDCFVAAIGLQAVRKPPLAGQEYAADCSGGAAEGVLPIFAALH